MVADSVITKHELQSSGNQIASSESRSVCLRHLDMGGMYTFAGAFCKPQAS